MDAIERAGFLAHAQTQGFKRRVTQFKELVREAFDLCRKPYLSCSGGKDSIAMLAIVDQVAVELGRDYEIWAHTSNASFPGTEETIINAAKKTGRKLTIHRSPVCAFEVLKRRKDIHQFGKTGFFFESIKEWNKLGGFDLAFVGVRAEESHRRMRAAKGHGHLFRSGGEWICNPLCWAKIDDVFAIALTFDYPIHPIYSKHHPDGIRAIRLGYLTAQDLLHRGNLIFIRDNYPDQYTKIIEARADLAIYA